MTTQETAADLHPFTFRRSGPMGPSEILLDGVDIAAKIQAVQLIADFTGTHVALDLHPGALNDGVEFDGLATVVKNTYEDDPGPAAVAFLSAIDPVTLERDALNRLDLDSEPAATTRAIIAQLIDYATGATP